MQGEIGTPEVLETHPMVGSQRTEMFDEEVDIRRVEFIEEWLQEKQMSICARFRECFTFYEADCEKLVNAFFAYTFFTKLELKRNDKQYNISQP